MFKVEIELGDRTINKVYQNGPGEDWVKYILKNYNVTKDKIKIFWIKNINKSEFSKKKLNMSENGKLSRGNKIYRRHVGDVIHKKVYNDFVNELSLKGKIEKKKYLSDSLKKVNKKHADLIDLDADDIFNKEWFIKEKEYELVELRFPYDEEMNFIGFNFDPER